MSFLKNIIKPVIPSKFWNDLRKKQILSKHKKVADLWNPIIKGQADIPYIKDYLAILGTGIGCK